MQERMESWKRFGKLKLEDRNKIKQHVESSSAEKLSTSQIINSILDLEDEWEDILSS